RETGNGDQEPGARSQGSRNEKLETGNGETGNGKREKPETPAFVLRTPAGKGKPLARSEEQNWVAGSRRQAAGSTGNRLLHIRAPEPECPPALRSTCDVRCCQPPATRFSASRFPIPASRC